MSTYPGGGDNDYQWSIDYGDLLGANPEGDPRVAVWLSPTYASLPIFDGGGGRPQRYTQISDQLIGVLTNTDLTTAAEKDAFDQNGNTVATAAIGQPLEIGIGWRDNGSLVDGPVLVDNFNFQGLLEYDEAEIRLANPDAQIALFRSTPEEILPGETVTLNWIISSQTIEAILSQNPGGEIGSVLGDTDLGTGSGSREVTPELPTTYTLEVTTPLGTGTSEVAVDVALLASFSSDDSVINMSESATLSWQARGDATVSILPDPGPFTTVGGFGEVEVSPNESTTYVLTASKPGEDDETAEVTVFVFSESNGSFSPPETGWDCEYDGKIDPEILGWNHNNNSDAWDGTSIGETSLGGIGVFTEGTDSFLRFQDPGDPRDSGFPDPSNRKVYFTKDLTEVLSPGYSPLLDGITLNFRVRVPTVENGPLDDYDSGGVSSPWPATGDGYALHNEGKSVISIYDSFTDEIISFAPSTTVIGPGGDFTAGDGLAMNRLVSTFPSPDVDGDDIAGTANLLDVVPQEWQDVWVTLEADTSGGGTHRADIYLNGSASPMIFHLTSGTGNDQNFTYAAMGLGATPQSGAVDIDFFNIKEGIHPPFGGGSTFQIIQFDYSTEDGEASFSWSSEEGQVFIVQRSTDLSNWGEFG